MVARVAPRVEASAGLNAGHRYRVGAAKRAGPPWDFDTPRPALLDSIDYVIAPRTWTRSKPPANWRGSVRRTARTELFAREGTAPHHFRSRRAGRTGCPARLSLPATRALAAKPGVAACTRRSSREPGSRPSGRAFGPGRPLGGVPDRRADRHLDLLLAPRPGRSAVTDVLERRARDPGSPWPCA